MFLHANLVQSLKLCTIRTLWSGVISMVKVAEKACSHVFRHKWGEHFVVAKQRFDPGNGVGTRRVRELLKGMRCLSWAWGGRGRRSGWCVEGSELSLQLGVGLSTRYEGCGLPRSGWDCPEKSPWMPIGPVSRMVDRKRVVCVALVIRVGTWRPGRKSGAAVTGAVVARG